MKSMIFTTAFGLMLMALVAAVDFDVTKQDLLAQEKDSMTYIKSKLTKFDSQRLNAVLDNFGSPIDEQLKVELWQEDGFNKNQIRELVGLYRASKYRLRKEITAIKDKLQATN